MQLCWNKHFWLPRILVPLRRWFAQTSKERRHCNRNICALRKVIEFASWMINVNTYIWLPRTANKNFNLCDKIRRTICNKAKVYISDRICRSCHKPQEKKPHTFAIKYISQKYCFIISLFLQSIACTILVRLVKFMYWIQRRIFF